MSLQFAPISPLFGAEVSGVDFRREQSSETKERLREAWHRHGLLIFRGHDLDDEQLDRVASIFGEISYEGFGHVKYVSNVMPKQHSPNGELAFHTDFSFVENPLRGLMLYAIEVPPPGAGGETMFASIQRALSTLPSAVFERIKDLRITHITHGARHESNTNWIQSATHPIVFPHPVTGERLLFVDERHFDKIEGVSEEESQALCRELTEHIRRPEGIVSHAWRPGDIAVWDNLKLQHARTDFDPKHPRHLRRTQLQGIPVATA